jgi:hypothetical protein
MKIKYLIIILLTYPFIAFGQGDHIDFDSVSFYGVKLISGSDWINSRLCQVEEGDRIRGYSPDDIKGYGFKGGRTYLSRIIKINDKEKRVFLERLNEGKLNLYYYKDRHSKNYFIEKDSGRLVEILKKGDGKISYKDVLSPYIRDCENASEALKLITYKKTVLSEFIGRYNDCENKPFPFIRYGLISGYSISKPILHKASHEILKSVDFKQDRSFNFGAFIDIPISNSYFSFHPEVYYQENAYVSHSVDESIANDILINTASINIPVLIRYTYPSLKLRPYINIGGIYQYNIRDDLHFYKTTITEDIIEIEEQQMSSLYPESQYGYAFGGGIQCKVDYRRSLFLEFRCINIFNIKPIVTIGSKGIHFIIGINI